MLTRGPGRGSGERAKAAARGGAFQRGKREAGEGKGGRGLARGLAGRASGPAQAIRFFFFFLFLIFYFPRTAPFVILCNFLTPNPLKFLQESSNIIWNLL